MKQAGFGGNTTHIKNNIKPMLSLHSLHKADLATCASRQKTFQELLECRWQHSVKRIGK